MTLESFIESRGMIQLRLLKNVIIVNNVLCAFFLSDVYFPLLCFFSLQFQAIDGDIAAHSRVRLISLIILFRISTWESI